MIFSASYAFSQRQQTNFGSEVDVQQPVKVPLSFRSQLSKDDKHKLERCQSEADLNLKKQSWSDHFVGSSLTVRNRIGELDLLVVQGDSGCFWGAHNTQFWILSKKKGAPPNSYRKLFEIRSDGLGISPRAKNIHPDVEVVSHTAVEGFTSKYRYLRGRYRETSCYAWPLGDESPTQRIRCSKYNWEFRK
jgi:hypothetical protein